ncbi:D-alanyl-D-alanine carboxypeptidase [Pseudoclavibacter sp. AY1F1]|nr:D-alanyl-D-alanine carboxypeptidase [Pseudoclavibacter sp. AY1F1]
MTVLVNKKTPLAPADYAPADLVAMSDIGVPSANGHSLRSEAATAVQTMFAAASAEAGLTLDMTSGYRDYGLQTELYNGYVADLGQEAADLTSARPGYSEHQTGLAADISSQGEGCVLEQCFAATAGGQWLAANAHRFGFILRFPDGATATTGYEFEPWHYRYVGTDTSAAMQAAGVTTYEEFLGAPAAPGY